jgi:hypothetical protein
MIIIIIFIPYIAQGAGSMHTTDQKYMGIFHNVSPGRLNFYIANMDERFLLYQKQIINFQWHENIPDRINTYGVVFIEKILYFHKTQLYFISYLYDDEKKAKDLVIKNESGSYQHYNLKESIKGNDRLSFAKIINNTLFFSFSANQETIYMMELDSGSYEVTHYNHQLGVIQNIWLKAQGDTEYTFSSEKDKEIISGVFKIIEQDGIELMEIYDYKVIGYDTRNGSFVYYNQDNILSHHNANDSAEYIIKEFMGKEEKIYDIFFLEDDSFIIASTRSGPDHFSNLFFGSGNLLYYFYYYHVKKHEQGGFIINKIKTFGALWKLEQLIL